MKKEYTDPRTRYTQNIVKKCLLQMLSEKKLNEITVSELCKKAELTRGTFYNHFYDVYDVYESIEEEFLSALYSRLDKIKAYDFDNAFFKEIIKFLSQNRDFIMVIIANLGKSSLVKNMIAYACRKYMTEFGEHYPELDKNLIKTVFTFNINGALGLLVEWMKDGMKKSPDIVADEISRFHEIILKGFFKINES